jgi:hypothetical protein
MEDTIHVYSMFIPIEEDNHEGRKFEMLREAHCASLENYSTADESKTIARLLFSDFFH